MASLLDHGALDRALAHGDTAAAVGMVRAGVAGGDPHALFQQAIWQLAGSPLPRNLPAARESLRLARERGHEEAAVIETALVANGTGGTADWGEARMLLAAATPRNATARRTAATLDAMALDPTGAPAQPLAIEDLTADGSVRRVRHCLTPAECAHVAEAAAGMLAPAVVSDPRTGRNVPHPIRTSDAATLPPTRENLVIRAINLRVAAISDTSVDQGEALTILRYQPGQQFRLHSDALPGVGNQRIKTVLLYLNQGYEGGETTFPDHGLTIAPAGGDAIIFTNTLPDGRPDPRMRHAGLPVRRGVKWLATRWIRARPFDVWQGPESA